MVPSLKEIDVDAIKESPPTDSTVPHQRLKLALSSQAYDSQQRAKVLGAKQ